MPGYINALAADLVSHLIRTVVFVAKAKRVLMALYRDGWVEIRRSGSHRILEKDGKRVVWSHHQGEDLGAPMLSRVAKTFGYTLGELRRKL